MSPTSSIKCYNLSQTSKKRQKKFTTTYAAEASLDLSGNLSKLYASLPSPDLHMLQGNYYALATVTCNKADGIL